MAGRWTGLLHRWAPKYLLGGGLFLGSLPALGQGKGILALNQESPNLLREAGLFLLGAASFWLFQRLVLRGSRRKALAKLSLEREWHQSTRRALEAFLQETEGEIGRARNQVNELRHPENQRPATFSWLLRNLDHPLDRAEDARQDLNWCLSNVQRSLPDLFEYLDSWGRLIGQKQAVDWKFEVSGSSPVSPSWNPELGYVLIRMVKKSVQNSLQHAQASRICLQWKLQNDGVIHVYVKDNGKGFDTGSITRGQGLITLRNQAEKAGAILYLDSTLGKGTVVHLALRGSDVDEA